MEAYNLVSLAGIVILMIVAWLLSTNRRIVNFRLILWGVTIQFLFAAFIFLLPAGSQIFIYINDIVLRVLGCAMEGAVNEDEGRHQ